MAFAVGAANVPGLGDWLGPGHTPRVVPGVYPILHTRNDSTSQNNTVNLFIDSADNESGYGASVISACADQTVYAIQCTSGPAYVSSSICGPTGAASISSLPVCKALVANRIIQIATLTVGASNYEFSSVITSRTLGYDVIATGEETCALAGTTAATCTAKIKATAGFSSTFLSTTVTVTGATYYRFDVAITGGAEKTATPVATCSGKSAATGVDTATGIETATSVDAATGLNPKRMALWAFAGVICVTSILTI